MRKPNHACAVCMDGGLFGTLFADSGSSNDSMMLAILAFDPWQDIRPFRWLTGLIVETPLARQLLAEYNRSHGRTA